MRFKSVNWRRYAIPIVWLVIVLASKTSQHTVSSAAQPFQRYSKAVDDDQGGFVPIVKPTDYQPVESTPNPIQKSVQPNQVTESTEMIEGTDDQRELSEVRSLNLNLEELQNVLWEYLVVESLENLNGKGTIQKRSAEQRAFITDLLFNEKLINRVKAFTEKYIFQAASGSSFQDVLPAGGRLFLFKGFKKLMWPIFIGVQVAKTVLLAMFLPSIIGSIGKMVGKGLVSVSGFGHPAETVDDFEFKDNPPPEDPPTAIGYNYPGQTANHANVAANSFDTAPAANNMLSLYDIAEPKPQFSLANTYALPEYAQNSRKETLQSKKDDFKVFHDIPASSMLLTNYDPFYSPLLSRLDSVFHQLNLNGDNEACREKLVCLMYASPAKYMPYSNLVSAQLSRELNELRKPTSDNVEILRFFKYMRAARDGQDGKNCHNIHKKCSSFTDTEQPAMLTTFNDINKLVQARKMQ